MKKLVLFILLVFVFPFLILDSFEKSSIQVQKESYYLGDTLDITGSIENGIQGDLIAVEIQNPNAETIVIRTIELGPGGTIDFSFKIPSSAQSGSYNIITTGDIAGQAVTVSKSISYSSEPEAVSSGGGGCLIATAAFGTELAPQVQQLRELRDSSLLGTSSGKSFMTAFNVMYYSFSPTISDWERQSPIFKEMVKITITPLLSSLSILNYVSMDSESEVLFYGISLILLNVGIYFATPVAVFKLFQKRKISQ